MNAATLTRPPHPAPRSVGRRRRAKRRMAVGVQADGFGGLGRQRSERERPPHAAGGGRHQGRG